jgi:hypothetical protein
VRCDLTSTKVRGKKNLVIERALAGPIGLFVKFSTLQEYGVDKVFFLQNNNVDGTQKNVIFLIRADNTPQTKAVAGMSSFYRVIINIANPFFPCLIIYVRPMAIFSYPLLGLK